MTVEGEGAGEVTESTEATESTDESTEDAGDEGSFFEVSDSEGTSEESNEDASEDDGEGELFAGKFKSVDELVKGYENANSIIEGKLEKVDDLTIKELAAERGIDLAEAPESYERDHFRDVMEDAGLTPFDDDNEEWNVYGDAFKELNLNQNQAEGAIRLAGQFVIQRINELGPETDPAEETAKLEELGISIDEAKEVGKWANQNLPSSFLTKPLNRTADGVRFLKLMKDSKKGVSPIQNSGGSGKPVDVGALNEQVDTLMASSAYNSPHDPGHKAANEKVEKLLTQLQRQKEKAG